MRGAVVLVLSVTFVLAGCGGDDTDSNEAEEYAEKSAETIIDDVLDAMEGVESVHMVGTVVEDGDKLDLDVQVNTDGECEGSIGMAGTGTIELLHVDGTSYFKADEEFWRSQAGDAAEQLMSMADGRWVTNTEDPNGFGELCDLDNFIDALEGGPDDIEVEGTGDVDGTDAVKLSFTSDDGNDGLVYVDAGDPHRILRFDVDDEGQLDFHDYDKELSVEKPDSDDVFDLAAIG